MTTLNDLVSIVRQRLNIQNAKHISDNDIRLELNRSLKELYELLLKTGEIYNLKEYEFDVTANSTIGFPLPEDFYRLLRVDRFIDKPSNTFNPMSRINLRDESIYTSSYYNYTSVYYSDALNYSYAVVSMADGYTYVRLYPSLNQIASYRVLYFPVYENLNGEDVVKIGATGQDWNEYPVLDACIKFAISEETDQTPFVYQKKDIIERITSSATAIDQQMPEPPPILSRGWYNNRLF